MRLLLLLSLVGCSIPTAPGPVDPLVAEWLPRAQECIGKELPVSVTLVHLPAPFDCEGFLTAGCFTPPATIEYVVGHEYVLRHELMHAMLYQAGEPWRNVPDCPWR
jgi:hypothetical protein